MRHSNPHRDVSARFLLRVPAAALSLLVVLAQAHGQIGARAGTSAFPSAQGPQSSSAAYLAGRVTHALTGAPIPRVLVQSNGSAAVLTDHEGRFRLPYTGQGGGVLQLTKPGFALSPERLDPPSFVVPAGADPLNLTITLWPDAVLTGTVATPDGEPLARVEVFALRSVAQNGTPEIQTAGFASTDSHGGFRIAVPPGDYSVETRYAPPSLSRPDAVLPSRAPARGPSDPGGFVHARSGAEQRFELRPQAVRTYHVTVPVEGAGEGNAPNFTFQTADGLSFQASGGRFAEAGAVSFDLPPGSYVATARSSAGDGTRSGQASITVPDHDATLPPLHLEPQPWIPVDVLAEPATANPSRVVSGSDRTQPNAQMLDLHLQALGARSPDTNGRNATLRNGKNQQSAFSIDPGTYRLDGGVNLGWTIISATYGGADLLHANLVLGPNAGAEPIRLLVSRRTGRISVTTRIGGIAGECWIVFVGSGDTLPRVLMARSGPDGLLSGTPVYPGTYRVLAMPFRHSADFADPAVLEAFQTYVKVVTVSPSSDTSIELDAVPVRELFP